MKRKEVIFFLLLFFSIPCFRIEAREILTLDLLTSIEQALTENPELDLIRREELLEKRIEAEERQALHITLSSHPQVVYRGGDLFPTFQPGFTIAAQRNLLGGTLSGNLRTSIDMLHTKDVESVLSISFHLPLVRNNKEKEREEESIYQREKEILVERVIEAYNTLLLQKKESWFLEQVLYLRELELEASQFTQIEEEEKKAYERLLKIEEQIKENKRAKKESEMNLRQLLHLDEEAFSLVEDYDRPIEIRDLDYWLNKALHNHQSILKAEERLKGISKGEGLFMDSGWSVDLSTGLDPYHISPLNEDPSFFIRVQAEQSFSFTNHLKREEKELARERATLELERVRETVRGQVKGSFQQLQLALEEVDHLLEEREDSLQEISLLETKYSLGLIGPLEVEERKVYHYQLEYSLLTRKSTIYVKYIDLLKSCGLRIVPEEGVRP